jgi:beta-glucosidase
MTVRCARSTCRTSSAWFARRASNKVNGAYCAENAPLLRDILKTEWAFDGWVESDWILGTRSTVASAQAGLDIEMPTAVFYGDALADAVESGAVDEALVDEAVLRILRSKQRFGLADLAPVGTEVVESDEHVALAREVAAKGIVLLRNEAGALPFDRAAIGSIVIVGELADTENLGDNGSSAVQPSYSVTPLQGIRDAAGDATVTYIDGLPFSPADETALADAGAVVVVVGLTAEDEGENLAGIAGGDRETLALSADHESLIAAVATRNARTVVVLQGGSAITVEPWIETVEAAVMAWYPGLEGGNALASILFGDVNPSGKLPITFAASAAQLPPFDHETSAVTYDYFHGYRLLDRSSADPRFPFGHGLSYTTFSYDAISLSAASISVATEEPLTVSVEVTNTGTVDGDEIVQLYVSYQGSSVERPVRELEAFRRVSIAAGATETVELEITARALAFWGGDAWTVEALEYTVHAGGSSRDLPLSAPFTVQ